MKEAVWVRLFVEWFYAVSSTVSFCAVSSWASLFIAWTRILAMGSCYVSAFFSSASATA